MTRPRGWLVAIVVGLPAFAVYLQTLYPGLAGTGDTPELQFVGRVLGTAHAPGYPVYVLVSWAFGHLPIRSLAYRINLLSAGFGSLAAALVALSLLRLSCRPSVAAAIGLACAFGRVFWSQAIIAEVYSMAAVLLAGVLLGLLAWAATRSSSALTGALVCSALALAHHSIDIVLVAPAVVLFAVMTDARASLRPRVIAGAAAAAAAGILAYGWVVLRTAQAAPYLGAHASSLREVVDLLRGGPFARRLFAFDAKTVIFERLPLAARILRQEFEPGGLLVLAVGIVVLLWQRRREAVLFLLGAAGVLTFAVNYDVPDIDPFLIPIFVLLWPVAGIGLEALLTRARAVPKAALALVTLALPATAFLANFHANDHSRHDFEDRYFRAVMDALPGGTAIVYESYTVEQMLRYQLLGQGYAERKQIALSSRDSESLDAYRRRGFAVFAFERGAAELEKAGWTLAPYVLPDRPLAEHVKQMPKGAIAVWAGPPVASGIWAGLDAGMSGCVAGIQVAGAETAEVRTGSESAELRLAKGEPIRWAGTVSPIAIRATCRHGASEIEVERRLVGRSDFGLALVVVSGAGRVVERHDLCADAPPRVPFNPRAFPFFRVVGDSDCAQIEAGGFVDVTRQATGGRLLISSQTAAALDMDLVIWLASDREIEPWLSDTPDTGSSTVGVVGFRRGDRSLVAALAADGLGHHHRIGDAPFLTRLVVRIDHRHPIATLALDLGGLPSLAIARRVGDPWRATFCRQVPGGAPLLAHPSDTAAHIDLGAAGAPYLGQRWWGPENEGPLGFRWSASAEAELLIPLARRGPFRVEVHARPAEGGADTIGLQINDVSAGTRTLRPGWSSYSWTVPASAWRAGTNRVRIRVPRLVVLTNEDRRALGVAVARLRLVPLSQ